MFFLFWNALHLSHPKGLQNSSVQAEDWVIFIYFFFSQPN